MSGECRDVFEGHARDLAAAHLRFHLDQPGGSFEHEDCFRLGGGDDASFDESRHNADGVGARHRRVFHLLHDDEAGVGAGIGRRQQQIAVRRRIPAGLAQHALAQAVGVLLEPDFLLELYGQARRARRR